MWFRMCGRLASCFLLLLTQYFPWDHPIPSDAKDSAFVKQGRLMEPTVVVACAQPCRGLLLAILSHLSSPQFLHERVFVSQEMQCTVSDLRAMISMPWFLDSVPTSFEPSITPSPTLSPHVVLSLSPQFFIKSSVEESKPSQPPCKPRRSWIKGFGRWSLKTTAKIASHQQEASQCASTDFVKDHGGWVSET
jgi:hypothetical protein